jgi:hypothetical protein
LENNVSDAVDMEKPAEVDSDSRIEVAEVLSALHIDSRSEPDRVITRVATVVGELEPTVRFSPLAVEVGEISSGCEVVVSKTPAGFEELRKAALRREVVLEELSL